MRLSRQALMSAGFGVLSLLILLHIWLNDKHIASFYEVEAETATLKFFVYQWPMEVVDSWPKSNTHHRISIHEAFRANSGTGMVLDRERGMHHTHQYSLFTLFYERLLISPHRTLDPAAARIFFIPYDLGMDSTTRSVDGALAQTNCPRLPKALELLQQSPYFARSGGANHFLLHSINQMMVYYANDHCAELYKLCYNCTKLSIDTYPPGVFDHLDRRPHLSHRWISIPFPSNYHHSANVTAPLWNAIQRVPHYMRDVYAKERPYALSFVGTTAVTARLQQQLRTALVATCREQSNVCLYLPLRSHESHESIYSNKMTDTGGDRSGHRWKRKDNPYARSRLCLMPGGDFPTRKGFFDALHSGCVPVIFERTAALTQWPLHWQVALPVAPQIHTPEQQLPHRSSAVGPAAHNVASECVVFVPRDVAMRNMTETFTYLVRLSSDVSFMSKKLECIASVAYQLQYGLPEGPQETATRRTKWGRDAFDVILEHLLS